MGARTVDVLWRSLDPREPSLEHLCLTAWTRAEGTVVGAAGWQAYTLNYLIEIGADDSPSFIGIDVLGGEALTLRRSAVGVWTAGPGRALPELRGCTDVDIRVTPFTNTLPIRRLGLHTGGTKVILAAWIDVPSLEVRAVHQRYTRLSGHTYRYEDLESGYAAEIEVDQYGLVTRYPGAFERVDLRPPG